MMQDAAKMSREHKIHPIVRSLAYLFGYAVGSAILFVDRLVFTRTLNRHDPLDASPGSPTVQSRP